VRNDMSCYKTTRKPTLQRIGLAFFTFVANTNVCG